MRSGSGRSVAAFAPGSAGSASVPRRALPQVDARAATLVRFPLPLNRETRQEVRAGVPHLASSCARLVRSAAIRALGAGPALRWRQLLRLDGREVGVLGERFAQLELGTRGWRLRGRRLSARGAELDLVMVRGRTLALVEVKTGVLRTAPPIARLAPPLPARPGRRLVLAQRERLERIARIASRSWRGPVALLLAEVLLDPRSSAQPRTHWTLLGRWETSPLPDRAEGTRRPGP